MTSSATDADRSALALAIAITEGDKAAAAVLLDSDPAVLMNGLVRVIRTLAGQRVLDSGGEPSDETIAASLRDLLATAFAEHADF